MIGLMIRLPKPFVDERGSIQNLLSVPVGNVALIKSKRGAIRSNHFHRKDWHYLYVLSGRVLYFERPIGFKGFPPSIVCGEGSMVFTMPATEHAVLFLADSEVLSMARNPQTHDEHEEDVVRVSFLSREYADALLKEYP